MDQSPTGSCFPPLRDGVETNDRKIINPVAQVSHDDPSGKESVMVLIRHLADRLEISDEILEQAFVCTILKMVHNGPRRGKHPLDLIPRGWNQHSAGMLLPLLDGEAVVFQMLDPRLAAAAVGVAVDVDGDGVGRLGEAGEQDG